MKTKLLLIILISAFSPAIYCGGSYFYGNIYNDHINGKIDSIVETITFQRGGIPDTKFITESTLEYRFSEKGLIIIITSNIKETRETKEMIDGLCERKQFSSVDIYYNEYFNNDIRSSNKLNYNIELMSFILFDNEYNEYNIKIRNNAIEITQENEIRFNRVILKFDRRTKRLVSKLTEGYSREGIRGRKVRTYTDDLLYEYDELGRLAYIYSNINKEKILRKNIYYDGILQPRIPFYNNLWMHKNEEIIICDGDRLKYRVILRKIHAADIYRPPSFYTVIFYDEKMNQIEQLSKDMEGREERYIINNIKVDSYNNPIHIEYNQESIYNDNDDFHYSIERNITYQ
jgi:hypothetical protein